MANARNPANRETPATSDEARAAMLVTLLTTESSLIWSRYGAMLTANTIVAAVIVVALDTDNWRFSNYIILFVGSGFGLILSLLWRRLTIEGWQISKMWCQELFKINIGGSSILATYFKWHEATRKDSATEVLMGTTRDTIETKALKVIYLFILAYAIGVVATSGIFIYRWVCK